MARGIDHLVIGLRDLDAGARFYETLGFQVGGRNRHPWGTENRIVQFRSSFLELIAVADRSAIPEPRPQAFSFGAFVRDYLDRREGLAMLVLTSEDARADAAAFSAAGIGTYEPFAFERQALRPDGGETRVAFSLAFAEPLSTSAGLFVCRQETPENFWNPRFQKHPNGATGIAVVALAAANPPDLAERLAAFAGAPATMPGQNDFSIALASGRIDGLTVEDAAYLFGSVEADPPLPAFVAVTLAVADLDRVRRMLSSERLPYQEIGSRVVVPASVAHGVAIAFELG
ncbi:MAG TPA: VOC family protein [Beijerinckiaceae bacterium]|jgi:catechol 2,3-dioxygenase-like lactoylglutathione lyase family enzyme